VRLAGAFVIKTAILLRVSRVTVFKVMSASTKRKSGRKSTLTERDHRILRINVSKNYRTTAAQLTAELNIRLEDRFHKTARLELHKSYIHGRAATIKPLITESNTQMCKR
jgi:hypothetical protein